MATIKDPTQIDEMIRQEAHVQRMHKTQAERETRYAERRLAELDHQAQCQHTNQTQVNAIMAKCNDCGFSWHTA